MIKKLSIMLSILLIISCNLFNAPDIDFYVESFTPLNSTNYIPIKYIEDYTDTFHIYIFNPDTYEIIRDIVIKTRNANIDYPYSMINPIVLKDKNKIFFKFLDTPNKIHNYLGVIHLDKGKGYKINGIGEKIDLDEWQKSVSMGIDPSVGDLLLFGDTSMYPEGSYLTIMNTKNENIYAEIIRDKPNGSFYKGLNGKIYINEGGWWGDIPYLIEIDMATKKIKTTDIPIWYNNANAVIMDTNNILYCVTPYQKTNITSNQANSFTILYLIDSNNFNKVGEWLIPGYNINKMYIYKNYLIYYGLSSDLSLTCLNTYIIDMTTTNILTNIYGEYPCYIWGNKLFLKSSGYFYYDKSPVRVFDLDTMTVLTQIQL